MKMLWSISAHCFFQKKILGLDWLCEGLIHLNAHIFLAWSCCTIGWELSNSRKVASLKQVLLMAKRILDDLRDVINLHWGHTGRADRRPPGSRLRRCRPRSAEEQRWHCINDQCPPGSCKGPPWWRHRWWWSNPVAAGGRRPRTGTGSALRPVLGPGQEVSGLEICQSSVTLQIGRSPHSTRSGKSHWMVDR